MANVNAILEEIQKNDTLSRSWRAASKGSTYAPVVGETWRVYPSEPLGSPLGGQTAVKGVCGGMERSFWPSWLVKTFPVPQGSSSSKVTLMGHSLDGKPISSVPLEDLLKILQEKDLVVDSIEATVAFKRIYEDNKFVDLRKEVVNLYRWKTVERKPSSTKE